MLRHGWPFRRGERGQALVLFAAGLAAFLAMVGLSVDVGLLVYTRTDLQKAADAAALAGSQDLPNTTLAKNNAKDYVAKNASDSALAEVTFSKTYADNDTITVKTNRHVNYTFLRAIGLSGTDVSARATVRKNTYVGGSGVVPWGFIASNNSNSKLLQNSCYLGKSVIDGQEVINFKQGVECTIKYGAGSNSGGDFGAVAIDDVGANEYRDDIGHGSTKPIKVGDKLEPQTGNMVGPTGQGIDDRFAMPAPSGCAGNARDDVLTPYNGTTGSVSIRPGCESSPRIIIVPVVDQIDNNSGQQSTVLGFAYLFLIGTSGGGQGTVKVEFVKFVTELPNSVYTGAPDGGGAVALKMVQ